MIRWFGGLFYTLVSCIVMSVFSCSVLSFAFLMCTLILVFVFCTVSYALFIFMHFKGPSRVRHRRLVTLVYTTGFMLCTCLYTKTKYNKNEGQSIQNNENDSSKAFTKHIVNIIKLIVDTVKCKNPVLRHSQVRDEY